MEDTLFTISKVLGVVPFNHNQKQTTFTDFTLMLVIPIVYLAAYIFTCIQSNSFDHLLGCPAICSLGHHMFLHLGAAVYFVSYFLSLSKKSFYASFFNTLNEIDTKTTKCIRKIPELKPQRIGFQNGLLMAGVGMFAVGLAFDSYNLYTMVNYEFALIVFTYGFPFLVASVVQAQFMACIHGIASRFTELNRILETICDECDMKKSDNIKLYDIETEFKTLEKNEKNEKHDNKDFDNDMRADTERYLVDVFKLHDRLCQLGVTANSEFSLPIVFFMTASFVIIVFGIFVETKVVFLVRGLNRYLDYIATSYVIWGVIFSLIAYVVLRLCCRAQKESKRSALLIHEIMQRKPAFMLGNDIFYNRMKGFTLQFLHWENYFHFNGIGLFQLDYTFIFSAISAATSYLIVLLQFDLTAKLKSDQPIASK